MAIGASAYKLVLDATQFVEGSTLSRKETQLLKQVLRETATQSEVYGAAVDKLGELHSKGALSADQYERALAKVREETAPMAELVKEDKTAALLEGSLGAFGKIVPVIDVANVAMKAFGAVQQTVGDAVRYATGEISRQIEEIDGTVAAADKLGITAASFQNISTAARYSNLSVSEASNAVEKMLDATSKAASGNREAAETFRMLGLDARKLREESPDKALSDVLGALQGIGNQADRVQAAIKIFGDADALRLSADAISEADRRLELFGGHISEIDRANFDRFDTAWKNVQDDLDSVWRRTTADLLPAFADIGELTRDLIGDFNAWEKETHFIQSTADAVRDVTFAIRELKEEIKFAGGAVARHVSDVAFQNLPGSELANRAIAAGAGAAFEELRAHGEEIRKLEDAQRAAADSMETDLLPAFEKEASAADKLRESLVGLQDAFDLEGLGKHEAEVVKLAYETGVLDTQSLQLARSLDELEAARKRDEEAMKAQEASAKQLQDLQSGWDLEGMTDGLGKHLAALVKLEAETGRVNAAMREQAMALDVLDKAREADKKSAEDSAKATKEIEDSIRRLEDAKRSPAERDDAALAKARAAGVNEEELKRLAILQAEVREREHIKQLQEVSLDLVRKGSQEDFAIQERFRRQSAPFRGIAAAGGVGGIAPIAGRSAPPMAIAPPPSDVEKQQLEVLQSIDSKIGTSIIVEEYTF